jgi:hypothetical protein
MRGFGVSTAALLLLLGWAHDVNAAEVPFTGTMSLRIGDLATIPIAGSGVATINGSGAGHPITQLTLPSGAFATASATVPVANRAPFVQIRLQGPGGFLENGAIALATSPNCTASHPRVSCPGTGLNGTGGLQGTLLIGVFNTQIASHTTFSLSNFTPGPNPAANLSIPLSRVGAGSTVTRFKDGYVVTLSGAGWTTGTAFVLDPLQATTWSLAGSRSTNPSSGGFNTDRLTLVSPVQIFNTATNAFIPSFATISVHFTPEPSGTLLLLGGLASVGALALLRRGGPSP